MQNYIVILSVGSATVQAAFAAADLTDARRQVILIQKVLDEVTIPYRPIAGMTGSIKVGFALPEPSGSEVAIFESNPVYYWVEADDPKALLLAFEERVAAVLNPGG